MKITDQDRKEIVAIQFGTKLLFGQRAIERVRSTGDFTQLISRALFKFMALMDLGSKYEEFTEYPTIFNLEDVEAKK